MGKKKVKKVVVDVWLLNFQQGHHCGSWGYHLCQECHWLSVGWKMRFLV